ncbi:hypothetical protein PGB90_000377 [Kerria lacca]
MSFCGDAVVLPTKYTNWNNQARIAKKTATKNNNLSKGSNNNLKLIYVSSHHNRSQSVRTPGSKSNVQVGINGTSRYKPNYLCLPQQRTRVASMPNTGVEEEYYRLRQFSISGKNIINRGDSLKSRRSRSNTSVASSNSSHR